VSPSEGAQREKLAREKPGQLPRARSLRVLPFFATGFEMVKKFRKITMKQTK
jgi:hypothetical protein